MQFIFLHDFDGSFSILTTVQEKKTMLIHGYTKKNQE